ncbi:uncharacterized protein LOC132713529 [Ruditapes philippinarum]|uniref:uncharacterized protein LOC132713529 n=1 Tax=Ruditapes philippinarum TaxID=129788 RepID=UPI00295B9B66|nr:uncharacterized protein LOC132713529 [Ruditapes philippinarum]
MPFDIYNKEFQNWLKGVFGLNTTRTALCECISDKLDNVLSNNSNEELYQYFLCLKANNISLLNTKSKGSTDKRWECEHESCRDIMRYFIDNHKQGHKLKYTWAPLGKSENHGTAGGGYHCKELKWNVIKLYMHIENEDVMKQCTSLDNLDITHVIKIMRNCKLISTNDLDEPLDEVLASRNKFMHSPDNTMTDSETSNTIQCTRKLLDCLDIAEKTYYKNAAQELHDLSENDFVLRYQSEECKRILADVKDAKHLADELYSAIKEDNLSAKSQSKRLQDTLERTAGLWSTSTSSTKLEMKPVDSKNIKKNSLGKKN